MTSTETVYGHSGAISLPYIDSEVDKVCQKKNS